MKIISQIRQQKNFLAKRLRWMPGKCNNYYTSADEVSWSPSNITRRAHLKTAHFYMVCALEACRDFRPSTTLQYLYLAYRYMRYALQISPYLIKGMLVKQANLIHKLRKELGYV